MKPKSSSPYFSTAECHAMNDAIQEAWSKLSEDERDELLQMFEGIRIGTRNLGEKSLVELIGKIGIWLILQENKKNDIRGYFNINRSLDTDNE